MKRILILSGLYCLLLAGMMACKKDASQPKNINQQHFTPGAVIPLAMVKTIDTTQVFGDNKVTGVIISDPSSNNLPQGYVIMQDSTGGIVLSLNVATANSFLPGDSLLIDLNGSSLGNVLGTTLLRKLDVSKIKKVGTGKFLTPTTLSLSQLNAGFSRYEATLVRLLNIVITPQVITETTYEGDKLLADGLGASSVVLHTEAVAPFAKLIIPESATFSAIPLFFNTINENTNAWATKRLVIQNISEVVPVVIINSWQFGNPVSTGTEISYSSTSTNEFVDTSVLTRGSGNGSSKFAGGFQENVKIATATKADAIANNSYFQFSIRAKQGHVLSLSGISSRLRRSGTGARVYSWQYSFNGTDFTQIGDDISFTSTTTPGVDQPPVDLSDIVDLQNISPNTIVTFRMYAWGFTSVNSGTIAIGGYAQGVTSNSLSISGNIR